MTRVRDSVRYRNIVVGLAALEHRADVAFVCATDVPFLHPAFVRRVLRACADSDPPWDVVLPVARGHAQPLAAAYRPGLAPLAAKFVAADRLRPAFLFDECRVLRPRRRRAAVRRRPSGG